MKVQDRGSEALSDQVWMEMIERIRTNAVLSGSRNGEQASTTRSTGVGELSKKSNNSFGTSEVDKDKKQQWITGSGGTTRV